MNNMKLFYKKYGDAGDPVFILHGVFGMLDNWHNIARKLSADYTVYTVDQRNHGHSPHAPSMLYEEMADDLAELLNALQISSAHILGHSMGGKTAMKFAAMHPDKVRSLIVADIAPRAYKGGHIELMDALDSIDFSKVERRSDADEQLSRFIEDQNIRSFLLKNLYLMETGIYGYRMNLPAIRNNYEHIIDSVHLAWPFSGPALFLKGEYSGYVRKDDEEEIISYFPDAQFITIPTSGHWIHAENPGAFLTALRNFLDPL